MKPLAAIWALALLLVTLSAPSTNAEDWTDWEKQNASSNCYINQSNINQKWILKWSDEFTGDSLAAKWTATHETKFCSGNGVDDSSCSVRTNAYTVPSGTPNRGLLIMQAKHGNHFTRKFTGARLTSQYFFPLDSTPFNVVIEVRAAMPVGAQLYASIFAMNKKEFDPYDFHYGWLELVTNYQRNIIQHGAHYRKPNILGQVIKEYEHADLSQFNLYRVHWNGSNIGFSFNDNRTEGFDRASSDPSEYRMVLMIGVGGTHFHQPLPAAFSDLNWLCPALMVDYVRVFEITDTPSEWADLKPCVLPPPISNDQIQENCGYALEHSEALHDDELHDDESDVGLGLILFVAITLVSIVLLLFYVLARSGKLGNTAARTVGTSYARNDEFLFEYNQNNGGTSSHHESGSNGAFDGRN